MRFSEGSVLVKGDAFLEALGNWRNGEVDFTYLDVADMLLHHEKLIFTTPRAKLERKFVSGPWARARWRERGLRVFNELKKKGIIQVYDKSIIQWKPRKQQFSNLCQLVLKNKKLQDFYTIIEVLHEFWLKKMGMNKRELNWRQVEEELGFVAEECIDWGEFGFLGIIIPDKLPDLFKKMSTIDDKTKAKYISDDIRAGVGNCLRTFFISYVTDIPAVYCQMELPEIVAALRMLSQESILPFKDVVLEKVQNLQANLKQMLVSEKIFTPLEFNIQLPPTLFMVLKECTRPEEFLDEIYTLRQSKTVRDFRKWCTYADKARKSGDIKSLVKAVQELTSTAKKMEEEFSIDRSETKTLELIPNISLNLATTSIRGLYELMEFPLSKFYRTLRKRHLLYIQRLGRSVSSRKSVEKELTKFDEGMKQYKNFERMVTIISELERDY